MFKFCTKCKTTKDLSSYHKDRTNSDGVTHHCKSCRKDWNDEWRSKNKERINQLNRGNRKKRKEYYSCPERKMKYRELELKRVFGIGHSWYEDTLKSQGGVCMICKKHKVASNKFFMTIDHCHATGQIRGILCNWCNRGLGAFDDNIECLASAIRYLIDSKEQKDKIYIKKASLKCQ